MRVRKMDPKQSERRSELDQAYTDGYKCGQHDFFIPMLVCGLVCGAVGYILALVMA